MRVLLATASLAGLGGSETYVVTVADHLQRLGHDIWLYTGERGESSEVAEELGLRVLGPDDPPPEDPDVLVVQDGVVACELAITYPATPQVFVAHSDMFDLQLPPQLPGLTALVVALYDRVEARIRALALEHEVVRLTQPVDVERFKPTRPLPERPRVALTFGNYVHGERLALLRRGCERAGIELRHVGAHGQSAARRPQEALNDADIVFAKARAICEAMACGRAAYVFDHNGGEGWVTAESYAWMAADNFGGQSRPRAVDGETLAADLERYEPSMGIVNRDLAVSHHGATKHAAALVEVLRRVAGSQRKPVDAQLDELARMIRLRHKADAQAFELHVEAERVGARVNELELEAQRLRTEAEQARADASQSQAEAAGARAETERALVETEHACAEVARARADTEAAWGRFTAVAMSRRWRAVQALMAVADRLRGRPNTRRGQPS